MNSTKSINMPAGAVIGAVRSVAGGVASGKGAKKAAKIQAQTQAKQWRMLKQMYHRNEARFRPEFHAGTQATNRLKALLDMLATSALAMAVIMGASMVGLLIARPLA